MKTPENQKSTAHQPATQKPFFGAASDRPFFSPDRTATSPFFQAKAASSSIVQAKSATNEAESNDPSLVQRIPAFESEVPANESVQRSSLPLQPSSALPIQAKLTVGQVGDQYEQEADRVAAQVVEQINAPPSATGEGQAVQRMGQEEEDLQMQRSSLAIQRVEQAEEEDLQMMPMEKSMQRMGEEDDELQMMPIVQRVGAEGGTVSADLEGEINAARSGGQSLAPELQAQMGQAMGANFSGVRVHTDARADQLNRSLNSRAFTTKQDLFFKQGEYQPGSQGGQELIAHELTHVVQQSGGSLKLKGQNKSEVQKKEVQESTEHIEGVEKIRSVNTNEQSVQRRFGFEIELPIFFTSDYGRGDGSRMDPGNAVLDQGNFQVKVDHNEELTPLVKYANENQNGNQQGFPHGPSIIELVTKPMDEFQLTETDVRNRASNLANWANNAYQAAKDGDANLEGNYYVGSDSPRRTLQSTRGYFQTTYGVKLSGVPDLFKETAKRGKKNSDDTAAVDAADQLTTAAKAGDTVVKALKKVQVTPSSTVKQIVTNSQLGMLKGYTALLANYLCADVKISKGVGLGKNKIGDYFYKTDLGALSANLPATVKNVLRVYPHVLDLFINELSHACDRDPAENMAVGMTIHQWVSHVINGGSDIYLNALKNPNSAVLNSEKVGPAADREWGVIMENREPQKLDKGSKEKGKQFKREFDAFIDAGLNTTKDKLEDFLSNATDPKKYEPQDWGSIMVLVYKLLRQINR
jgi:hypothetical protein